MIDSYKEMITNRMLLALILIVILCTILNTNNQKKRFDEKISDYSLITFLLLGYAIF